MRIPPTSPLFFLLAPPLISAQLERVGSAQSERLTGRETTEVLTNEEILALNHAPKDGRLEPLQTQDALFAEATSTSPTTSTSTRRYVGTDDAPVDGQDGKPHAGPFVDTTPENGASSSTSEKSIPTSLKNFETTEDESWRLTDIPQKNDGVMNDDNRQIPKKGTTGTEGGISEKEKLKASKIGEEKEPLAPKVAPPLPYSEEQHIESSEERGSKKGKSRSTNGEELSAETAEEDPARKGKSESAKQNKLDKESKDAVTGKAASDRKNGEYGEGGHLLEKPTDLPEKPHNIPIPEPKAATQPGSGSGTGDGPPVTGSGRDRFVTTDWPDTEGKTPRPPKTKKPKTTTTARPYDEMDWHEWIHAFVLSFTMIIFSEIGDKTFLVAALMAMRHARWVVFTAALTALTAMTILSAVLGHAFPTLLPRRLTTFAAAILFFVFGAKSLREGLAMPKTAGVGEEMKEVEAELEENEHKMARRRSRADNGVTPFSLESGRGRSPGGMDKSHTFPSPSASPSPSRRRPDRLSGLTNLLSLVLSPAWVQTFIMTFLGEWGDRSQIATIAMAAGQDYWWVTLGAILGHACCTGIAVIGGRALAGRVSMRVVTIGGAIAFLVFGVIYLYECAVE